MTKNEEYARRIYDDMKNGSRYGYYLTNVRYPMFCPNLYIGTGHNGKKYIFWEHYGSSAHVCTLRDLKWIIKHIFNQTPEEFYKTHLIDNSCC